MRHLLAAAAIVVLASAAATAVRASDYEHVGSVTDPATLKECAECHMAFQPALLPAESWNRVMDGLADHFGDNASLPSGAVAAIRDYLTGNAGRGNGALLRITEQRWWEREHRFRPTVWARDDVRSKANCEACHRDAVRGRYEDD